MRDSGNFVLYDYHNDSYVIWNSFDFPTDTISSGQNLSIMDRLVSSVSTSDKSSGRFYLDMQTDGNFVAYPVNSSGVSDDSYWSSGTPNSGDSVQLILSHIGIGNKADCNCYPGFEFINANNKFLGCYKNLSDDACRRSKDPSILYSIVPLENMWWTDYPYLVVPMEKEDCGKSCLKDCDERRYHDTRP
uniref:Bulb-type lectin domain-containing protein n=1 Tax=Fagus sylvatica TaxID=28930 RepID=A0A2N9H4Q6_FAGSY